MPALLSIRLLRDMVKSGPFGLLVESTAPLNVEDGLVTPIATPLVETSSPTSTQCLEQACAHLVAKAHDKEELSVVVQVHGFNNPDKVVYTRYGQAWDHYRQFGGDRLLYVGYRWPGEAMGSTISSSFKALPGPAAFLTAFSFGMLFAGLFLEKLARTDGWGWQLFARILWWVIALGALLGCVASLWKLSDDAKAAKRTFKSGEKASSDGPSSTPPLTLVFLCLITMIWLIFHSETVGLNHYFKGIEPYIGKIEPLNWTGLLRHLSHLKNVASEFIVFTPILIGGLLLTLPIVVILFRGLVYFRDAYRAEHFGVPDLVEFVRHLDAELDRQLTASGLPDRRISLSLIGHSMGALVVTGSVRILTDVFDQHSMANLDTGEHGKPTSNVGKRLQLGNMVLVSPDIPAEALMSGRANFLAASIHRFREAHLFSNEGDVVVRCISSLANAFSFPMRTKKHGQRLANAHVTWNDKAVKPPFGIVNPIPPKRLPTVLDEPSFLDLLYVTRSKITSLHKNQVVSAPGNSLATCLNYFDCTDYRDVPDDEDDRTTLLPALTYARRSRFLSDLDIALLLGNYLRMGWFMPHWRKDVHSAYFDFPTTRTLIYTTAHGGLRHAIGALSSPTVPMVEQVAAFHAATATLGLQVLLSEQSISTLTP